MEKKYVKLLEIGKADGFYSGTFELEEGKPETLVSRLEGRVFEVLDGGKYDGEWSALEGQLVGETLGDWDDGHYVFCEVRVEEVSNPTLM